MTKLFIFYISGGIINVGNKCDARSGHGSARSLRRVRMGRQGNCFHPNGVFNCILGHDPAQVPIPTKGREGIPFLPSDLPEDQEHTGTFKQAETNKFSPLATLFVEGYREAESIIKSLPDGHVTDDERPLISQEIERSLKITTQDEIVYMERYLAFLGTTGTVGPLLGLFGTVWGIMDAFYGIGLKGTGDIGALAPGLAAALINTISGLFVAIPAVIAYNYFADKIRDIAIRCDSFSMEFLSYLERNLLRRKL